MSEPTVITSENVAEFKERIIESRRPPEPVVAEAVEVKAEPEKVEPAPEKPEEEHEDEAARKKRGIEGRFSELTQRAKQAEERLAAAERRAQEAEAKLTPPTKAEPVVDPEIGPEPKPEDYANAFEYGKDMAQWAADKAIRDRDVAEAEKEQAKERDKVIDSFKGRVDAFKAETPDYDEVLASSTVGVSNAVRDAILESEHAPRILYEMAKDDALAARLALGAGTDRKQLVELGRLEARFDKATPEKVEPEPVKERPRAPAPITAVRGGKRADNALDGDDFKGTYQEYKAARQAQRAKH